MCGRMNSRHLHSTPYWWTKHLQTAGYALTPGAAGNLVQFPSVSHDIVRVLVGVSLRMEVRPAGTESVHCLAAPGGCLGQQAE